MNREGWPSNENQESFRADVESEKRPEKLYRAYTVNPEQLTIETLRSVIRPGTAAEDNPTRLDNNERGVYMSTNPRMVESCYAVGGLGRSYLDVPKFTGRRGQEQQLELPSCGIILEIDTKNVEIRKPRITETLKGVYNNGFEGDEWIADTVAPESYQAKKLVLSRGANDPEKITVPIDDTSDEGLEKAIKTIQAEYGRHKKMAEDFKNFLETMTEQERLNQFRVERGWEKIKKEIESAKEQPSGT